MNSGSNSLLSRTKAHKWASTFLVMATLAIGILIGTVISHGVKGKEQGIDSSDATPLKVPSPRELSNTFSQIAKQLEPSVVNINTESIPKQTGQKKGRSRRQSPYDQNPGGGDDPFQDFFDRFFGGQNPGGGEGGGEEGGRQMSLGSGVIVDPRGYIITNNHVVEKADRIRVKFNDDPPGVLHDARVVGTDAETDLAVIKVDISHSLPVAKLGNSDSMSTGDWVLAIGSPFGLEDTVTAGIVSSKGRNIEPRRQFQSFIQTDAAINPGNSGGPLVNMNGEVIGINTAIYTQSMGYQGVGFAMPSNTVASVYNQLIAPDHKVTRGSIGVIFNAQPNPAIARVYGVKNGVLIADVTPSGPAANAGLKQGDAITAVDGRPIKTGDELVADISSQKPGSKVKISYLRNGKESDATVTIADRAKLYADKGTPEGEGSEESKPEESKLGMSVKSVTSDLAERLQIPDKGVVVQDVTPGSFAEDVGLGRGDIIIEINKQQVNNEDDFRKIQTGLKSGQDVVFLVRQGRGRGAGTLYLAGTLP
jgi:serine protease Do